ncbi:hypothetical protein EXU85_01485 [Spirosoma sp. KCTC 42546]|uniref:DUF6510 family protein n=1 Tax=Spirosoma sp. KCTC 42546 TaxID=2520506 RepID=UPI001157B8EF|nr:DUF6510 family protein [Spirosoma sp. KCTC 42546]QDK77335.1 hypothetical protein EXU85_01485 [Spirosoma sp. KCTC 42546]
MNTDTDTINEAFRLDGNAVAGELQMLLGFDVTVLQTTCSHCQKEGQFATLLAYVRGPGIVLRCSTCNGMVLQVVKTPQTIMITVEGIVAGLTSTIIQRQR